MKLSRVSDAEWEVMEVIWQSHPITSSGIAAVLHKKRRWAANTVRTMLARLIKKRVVRYNREENKYYYRPAVERDQCVKSEVDSFLDRVFGGAASPLLVHFIKNRQLTPEEIRELRAYFEKENKS